MISNQETHEKFEHLHKYGAEKYGALWLLANNKAVNVARAYGIDVEAHKAGMTHVVLRVLQAATEKYAPNTKE